MNKNIGRKIFVFVLICSIVMYFPLGSVSAPVHVPARPLLNVQNDSQYPANIAVEVDCVTGRNLQEDIRITRANWVNFKVTEMLMDNKVQPYFLVGALIDGDFEQEVGNADLKYKTDDAFSWGIGTTILAYEINERMALGLDIKYRNVQPTVHSVTIDGNKFSRDDDNVSLRCSYQEWQAALGVCGVTDKFIGYGGIKYSDVRTLLKAEAGGIDTRESVGSAENVGVFVGCEFLLTEDTTIGLEGRFLDEEAYTCFITVHF